MLPPTADIGYFHVWELITGDTQSPLTFIPGLPFTGAISSAFIENNYPAYFERADTDYESWMSTHTSNTFDAPLRLWEFASNLAWVIDTGTVTIHLVDIDELGGAQISGTNFSEHQTYASFADEQSDSPQSNAWVQVGSLNDPDLLSSGFGLDSATVELIDGGPFEIRTVLDPTNEHAATIEMRVKSGEDVADGDYPMSIRWTHTLGTQDFPITVHFRKNTPPKFIDLRMGAQTVPAYDWQSNGGTMGVYGAYASDAETPTGLTYELIGAPSFFHQDEPNFAVFWSDANTPIGSYDFELKCTTTWGDSTTVAVHVEIVPRFLAQVIAPAVSGDTQTAGFIVHIGDSWAAPEVFDGQQVTLNFYDPDPTDKTKPDMTSRFASQTGSLSNGIIVFNVPLDIEHRQVGSYFIKAVEAWTLNQPTPPVRLATRYDVVPGRVHTLDLYGASERYPTFGNGTIHADSAGSGNISLYLKVLDSAGNPIPFAEVQWEFDGLMPPDGGIALDAITKTSSQGMALNKLKDPLPGGYTVHASSGGVTTSVALEVRPIQIQIVPLQNAVMLGQANQVPVTITITNVGGQPLAGIGVEALATKGRVLAPAGLTTDQNGQIQVYLDIEGDSEMLGRAYVAVSVGGIVQHCSVDIQEDPSLISISLSHRLLAADVTTSGTGYSNATMGTLKGGTPGDTVRLYLVGEHTFTELYEEWQLFGPPIWRTREVTGPITGLFEFLKPDQTTGNTMDVMFDATGTAYFCVQSKGVLQPEHFKDLNVFDVVAVPSGMAIPWSESPPPGWETVGLALYPNYRFASHKIATTSSHMSSLLSDLGGHFSNAALGVFLGNSDSKTAMMADMAFSLAPGIGGYCDVRDVVKETLKLWPGGDDPEWVNLTLSGVGILTEFLPVADIAVDAVKHLAASSGGALVGEMLRRLWHWSKGTDPSGLRIVGEQATYFVDHPQYWEFLDEIVGTDVALAGQWKLLADKLDPADVAQFLDRTKVVALANGLDAVEHAKKVLRTMGEMKLPALQKLVDHQKWDFVSKALLNTKAGWDAKSISSYFNYWTHINSQPTLVRYLDAIDEFADCDGVAELINKGLGVGQKAELDAALKCKAMGQKVNAIGEIVVNKATKSVATDLDVVTDLWVGNVKASAKGLDDIDGIDLQILLTQAQNRGLLPKILVPVGTLIPSKLQTLLQRFPAITIEFFTQG